MAVGFVGLEGWIDCFLFHKSLFCCCKLRVAVPGLFGSPLIHLLCTCGGCIHFRTLETLLSSTFNFWITSITPFFKGLFILLFLSISTFTAVRLNTLHYYYTFRQYNQGIKSQIPISANAVQHPLNFLQTQASRLRQHNPHPYHTHNSYHSIQPKHPGSSYQSKHCQKSTRH